MDNMKRLGGEAGVLAAIATAWLFLGLILVFPSAGLNLSDQVNPHRYLPFIGKHQVMFWAVNVLGGLLAAMLTAVLLLALGDRFEDHAPVSARLGPMLGVFGSAGFAVAALVRQIGFGYLSPVYASNKVGMAHAFYAMNGMTNSFLALGEVATGFGALILGNVMLRTKRYGSVGYMSVVTGTALILSGFIDHVVLFTASSVMTIVWLTWTSLALRSEVGPALFGRRSVEERASVRRVAT